MARYKNRVKITIENASWLGYLKLGERTENRAGEKPQIKS